MYKPAILIPFAFSVALLGCRAEEQITVYRIPKAVSGLDGLRDAGVETASQTSPARGGAAASGAAATGDTRMVVAIFQRDAAAWFFKVTGSPDDVTSNEEMWSSFIDDVKFETAGGTEEPQWELPQGWTTGPPAPFRFATIKLAESDLEIRVSKLGGQQDLLSNVNRWRTSQLGLPPATAANVNAQFAEKEGQGGKYLLFDQQGVSTGQTMGGPFMNRATAARPNRATPEKNDGKTTVAAKGATAVKGAKSPSLKNQTAPQRPRTVAQPEFDLTQPQGFEPGKTSSMVVARFLKKTDAGEVQISVVPLTAINNWNDNVNFWRQSVGLAKVDDEEIEAISQPARVSAIDGQRIELMGETGDAKIADAAAKGLIGVMIKKGDLAWFFKMIGPRAEVIAHKDAFDQFLESFTFKKQ